MTTLKIVCGIVCVVILIASVYMGFRNMYVFRTNMKITDAILKYHNSNINDITVKEIEADYFENVYDYDRMMIQFWKFGWRKFVTDELAAKIEKYM